MFSKIKLGVEYYAQVLRTVHFNKGVVIKVYYNFFSSFSLLVISITFDLCSLNLILLLSAVTARISLGKFAFMTSMVRGLFGKLSLSDILINNEAASDRASDVAKVPSK